MTQLAFMMAGALALLIANPVHAQDYRKGDLIISRPWARPAAEGASGAAYLKIENDGKEADEVLSVESPAAEKTELHETKDENGVMTMRAVKGGIEIRPGASVEFKPGGYHIMLLHLKKGLVEGEKIPLTIKLAKAGEIVVDAKVEKTAPGSAETMPMDMHGMNGMDHSMH